MAKISASIAKKSVIVAAAAAVVAPTPTAAAATTAPAQASLPPIAEEQPNADIAAKDAAAPLADGEADRLVKVEVGVEDAGVDELTQAAAAPLPADVEEDDGNHVNADQDRPAAPAKDDNAEGVPALEPLAAAAEAPAKRGVLARAGDSVRGAGDRIRALAGDRIRDFFPKDVMADELKEFMQDAELEAQAADGAAEVENLTIQKKAKRHEDQEAKKEAKSAAKQRAAAAVRAAQAERRPAFAKQTADYALSEGTLELARERAAQLNAKAHEEKGAVLRARHGLYNMVVASADDVAREQAAEEAAELQKALDEMREYNQELANKDFSLPEPKARKSSAIAFDDGVGCEWVKSADGNWVQAARADTDISKSLRDSTRAELSRQQKQKRANKALPLDAEPVKIPKAQRKEAKSVAYTRAQLKNFVNGEDFLKQKKLGIRAAMKAREQLEEVDVGAVADAALAREREAALEEERNAGRFWNWNKPAKTAEELAQEKIRMEQRVLAEKTKKFEDVRANGTQNLTYDEEQKRMDTVTMGDFGTPEVFQKVEVPHNDALDHVEFGRTKALDAEKWSQLSQQELEELSGFEDVWAALAHLEENYADEPMLKMLRQEMPKKWYGADKFALSKVLAEKAAAIASKAGDKAAAAVAKRREDERNAANPLKRQINWYYRDEIAAEQAEEEENAREDATKRLAKMGEAARNEGTTTGVEQLGDDNFALFGDSAYVTKQAPELLTKVQQQTRTDVQQKKLKADIQAYEEERQAKIKEITERNTGKKALRVLQKAGRAEGARQREIAAEAARVAAEAARQREIARLAATEAEAEAARQAELARRQAAEVQAQAAAEAARQAAIARQAAEAEAEAVANAAREAERQRLADEEAARVAEVARVAAEAAARADADEVARQTARREAENARLAEEEAERQREVARVAEERRLEAVRVAKDERQAEAARLAELDEVRHREERIINDALTEAKAKADKEGLTGSEKLGEVREALRQADQERLNAMTPEQRQAFAAALTAMPEAQRIAELSKRIVAEGKDRKVLKKEKKDHDKENRFNWMGHTVLIGGSIFLVGTAGVLILIARRKKTDGVDEDDGDDYESGAEGERTSLVNGSEFAEDSDDDLELGIGSDDEVASSASIRKGDDGDDVTLTPRSSGGSEASVKSVVSGMFSPGAKKSIGSPLAADTLVRRSA